MQIEFDILNFIQQNMKNDILTPILKAISYMGNAGIIWIIIALLFILIKKYRKIGITMCIGLVLCLIIGNGILKPLIARTRPYDLEINSNILIQIEKPNDYSFPSGHTLAAFTSAVIILLYNKRLGIFAIILASLMAFSRLYFYVHFPTDVLGGIILGIAFALISKWIVKRYFQNIDNI